MADAASATSPPPARAARARLARVILVVAGVSVAIGLGLRIYQSVAPDPWRTRIVKGEPVVVRFLCNAGAVVDCNVSVKITYRKSDSGWCEDLQRSDGNEARKTCRGNPERGVLDILGVPHAFDRFGAVRVDGRLVGQLFPP